MTRLTRPALPGCVAAVAVAVLLSGCTSDDAPERSSSVPRPLTTSTTAPGAAERLAERYRQAGGVEDVYGIEQSPGPDGVPQLVVWRHGRDDDAESFDPLKQSVVDFLRREDGDSLDQGYLLDVFGSDGKLLNRLDARP
ncbi:hypothetical protein [Streptomyces sp. CRN 30]|uniref:hypothetical protein n=1 Tax=Streptomyces sp. CRN 30 TaxID=3075613 RepID=UPI002A832F36|nr:hypothetical protein [Streptomyces sp. CRN 30]